MRAVASLKICTLMRYFCQKHIKLAKKEELSLMTLKSNPNFEVKLTFRLKNDMTILMNFYSNSEKSENLHFDGIFLSKLCNVWAKIIMSWKMTYDFKSDTRNLVNFHTIVAHWISTFWTFYCLSEVIQIPSMIFETRSQFLYKFCTIL